MKSSLAVLGIILASLGVCGQSLGQSVIPGVGPIEEEELGGPILEEEDSQSQPYLPGGVSKGIVSAGGGTVAGTNAGGTVSTTRGVGQSTQQLGTQTGVITPRTVQQRAQQQAAQILSGGANRDSSRIGRPNAQQQLGQRFQRPQAKQVTRRTLPFIGTRGAEQLRSALGTTGIVETPILTPPSRQQEPVTASVREPVSEPVVVQQAPRRANLTNYVSSLSAARGNARVQRQTQGFTRGTIESDSSEFPSTEFVSSGMPYGAAERDMIPSQRREIKVEHVSPGALVAAQKQKEEEAVYARQQQSLEPSSISYGEQRDATARIEAQKQESQRAAERARQIEAVRKIEGPAKAFLARRAQERQENAAARTIQGPVREFLVRKAQREEQWRQERIATIQDIGAQWNTHFLPERARLEQQHQAAVRDPGVVHAEEIREAYERLTPPEQAAWDNADVARRAQLTGGYQRIQAAERQLGAFEQQRDDNQRALVRANQEMEAAITALPGGPAGANQQAARRALADRDPDGAVAALPRAVRNFKRVYVAKRDLENQIVRDRADVARTDQEYQRAFARLTNPQKLKWNTQADFPARQRLVGEYDDIAALTGGDPVEPTPDLMRRLYHPLTEVQARQEAFERDAVVPFIEQARDEYVATLAHVPSLTLSKSLREAEALGKESVSHVLGTPTAENPIANYQDWSHDLGDLIAEGNAFERVRRTVAARYAGGQDVKGENRDAIIAHLQHSQVAHDLSWMAYGTPDIEHLSYAQKGALIKAHLAATGRDPHNPNGETWDEAHYAALRAGVPGLLPFDEIVGRMRACRGDEEVARQAAADDGVAFDEDFDC